MLNICYDLNSTSDLQKVYWEYVLNTIFDCTSLMTRTELEVEHLDPTTRTVRDTYHNTLHTVKDSLYEILLVTSNEHILDIIFEALVHENCLEVMDYYFVVLETLKTIYNLLGDVHSNRYRDFMNLLDKRWFLIGGVISAKSKYYFETKVQELNEYNF